MIMIRIYQSRPGEHETVLRSMRTDAVARGWRPVGRYLRVSVCGSAPRRSAPRVRASSAECLAGARAWRPLSPPPGRFPARLVLDNHARGRELIANTVGFGEILRLASRDARR